MMSALNERLSILEKEIDKLITYMHDLKQKNTELSKENDDLKNKLSIFKSDIGTQKLSDDSQHENKEIIKLKEKQERIKSELDGIIKDINSVLS